ncbi:uncharacterized protein K460DRAFT_404892 [Cucurbitaria berberidis CBS 394.84]|uniref:F-box domain-containing protein n=1 Tax=Cucurbitaria berberidis CBS 394.84 TaxID=1168544 RepID=A0A9P4GEL7_9PLEO|nr:uncharacterized protein K460DRAFT_404892 [Cucurbitaria berberidis CBS 394.84]KAF1844603.1 hypothetical protein K460DRAFT_404892 [Cucurbitaria berberidis CBS 394.84]
MAKALPSGPTSLATLPNELLDEVVSHLDRPSLLALALTCKQTKISSTEKLYRTYVNHEPPSKAPFHLFLRTICERPELADKVREVDIRGWRSEYEVATGAAWRGLTVESKKDNIQKVRTGPYYLNVDKVVRVSNADRFKIFTEAAVKAGVIAKIESYAVPALKSSVVWYTSMKEDKDFLRLLGRGVEDAQVVLMLSLLPKLEALRVDGISPYPVLDWHHFLSRSTTAPRALRCLQVRGSITKAAEPVVKTSLQVLDILPNLQDLQLFDIAIGGHQFTVNILPSKKLSSVVLSVSAVSLRLLRKLLDGQQLTHFTYLPGCRQVHTTKLAAFSAEDILTRLASSKTTLKQLAFFPIGSPNEPSSLKTFSHLTDLETPQPGLLNVSPAEADEEVLASALCAEIPSTVVTLSLRYVIYDAQAKGILKQLARLKTQGEFPDLRLVRLSFLRSMPFYAFGWPPLPDPEHQVRHDLGKIYREAGLDVLVFQAD